MASLRARNLCPSIPKTYGLEGMQGSNKPGKLIRKVRNRGIPIKEQVRRIDLLIERGFIARRDDIPSTSIPIDPERVRSSHFPSQSTTATHKTSGIAMNTSPSVSAILLNVRDPAKNPIQISRGKLLIKGDLAGKP